MTQNLRIVLFGRKVPKKIRVKNTKGRSLVCFRGSRRQCFCYGQGSGVSSMFWTSVVQVDVVEQKSGPYAAKKTTNCKGRVYFLLKCAD